jgi:hypothetical protein
VLGARVCILSDYAVISVKSIWDGHPASFGCPVCNPGNPEKIQRGCRTISESPAAGVFGDFNVLPPRQMLIGRQRHAEPAILSRKTA